MIDGRENRITRFLRTIKETFLFLFPRPKGFPVAFPSIPPVWSNSLSLTRWAGKRVYRDEDLRGIHQLEQNITKNNTDCTVRISKDVSLKLQLLLYESLMWVKNRVRIGLLSSGVWVCRVTRSRHGITSQPSLLPFHFIPPPLSSL